MKTERIGNFLINYFPGYIEISFGKDLTKPDFRYTVTTEDEKKAFLSGFGAALAQVHKSISNLNEKQVLF